MPGIDGFQLAERIKSVPDLAGTVILMLTSGDGPGDIERCEKVGGAAHLIETDQAIRAVRRHRQGRWASPQQVRVGSRRSRAARAGIRPLRILLAEDSFPNQRLAVGVLSKWGHTVTVANNGHEALAALDKEPFDLVLMDVQMPEMDGFRRRPSSASAKSRLGGHLPIVAMTAHAMKGDREECLAAGMDGYVAKPIRRAELQKVIQEILGPDATGDTATPASAPH